jgi:prepilin-type N-terminal cleavage/methylation domain-containing protein
MRKLFYRIATERGFTLIELLVVIAIIGFLAAAITASLQEAKDRATYATAAQHMRVLQTALYLYYDDHGYWPPGPDQAVRWLSDPAYGWDLLKAELVPYLKEMPYPDFPQDLTGGSLTFGYEYLKGTANGGFRVNIFDSNTGEDLGCLVMYEGYHLNFVLPVKTSHTLNDGGFDPNGLEVTEGVYTTCADPTPSPTPTST